MSLSLTIGCVWVLLATVTAMLPMRRQYVPGFALLLLAPVLLGFIGWQHGIWWAVAGGIAFLSMFRNPLIYFYRRARGLSVSIPSDEA